MCSYEVKQLRDNACAFVPDNIEVIEDNDITFRNNVSLYILLKRPSCITKNVCCLQNVS